MIQVSVIKGREGSERLQCGVVVGLIDPWKKVSWKAWEERSCLNGSFLSFFSPWPGQRLCMVIYERVGEREGLQWNPPALFVARAGLRCLSLVRFYHIYMHMHAHTLLRTTPRAARTEERTLLRGRFGKWGVFHTIAVSSLIDASQISKHHETSRNWRPLILYLTKSLRTVCVMSILWYKSQHHLGFCYF